MKEREREWPEIRDRRGSQSIVDQRVEFIIENLRINKEIKIITILVLEINEPRQIPILK